MSDWKKHIKSTMNEREIAPSDSAWDRLEAQLDASEKPQKKRGFYWISIAASLIIIATLGYFFLPNNNKTVETPIAKEEVKNEVIEPEIKTENVASPKVLPAIEKEVVDKKIELVENNVQPKQSKKIVQPFTEQKVLTKEENPIKDEIITETQIAVNKPIEQPIEEEKVVEMASPDELLADALKKRRLFEEQKVIVNSDKLLNQVEDEIYEEKSPDILEKLTNKVNDLRLALADRNQKK